MSIESRTFDVEIDVLDLKVDVTDVYPKKDFKVIARIIWVLEYPAPVVLFTTFGADAALTNGLQLVHNSQEMFPEPIKNNFDFSKYAYDSRIDTDATAAKIKQLISRMSFSKMNRHNQGIPIDSRREFFIKVQDDLSGSANTQIKAVLEGWR